MSSFENSGEDNPDISRIFAQKADRRFQRDFGRFMHSNQTNAELRRQSEQQQNGRSIGNRADPQMGVKLIEANETIELLRRQLEARSAEVERLRSAEASANDRAAQALRDCAHWKAQAEAARGKRFSSGGGGEQLDTVDHKTKEKLLLNDYHTALSKYRTWMQFAEKQLRTMKTLLEEHGGWTEANRYKIFFSYRNVEPLTVLHDDVGELAAGSILSYTCAIEDVESISARQPCPRFHSIQTQTDEGSMIEPMLSATTVSSTTASQQYSSSSQQLLNNAFSTAIEQQNHRMLTDQKPTERNRDDGMTAQELRLLDCERDIQRLEIECAQQRERIVILSERAKHVELLEEQKDDLQLQANILRRQNEQLIFDHEQLKCAFGGGAISRNSVEELVRNASQLKEKNAELEKKLRELIAQRDVLTTAESRRIAQLFKRKYEAEMNELRAKLQKIEPLHPSDTTRILRYATGNPLDEAHDELMIREVAAMASSASAAASSANPRKRKFEDNSAEEEKGDKKKPLFEGRADGEEHDEDEDEPGKVHELRVQLAAAKHQLEQTEKTNSDYLREFREVVALLSGYDIRVGEEGFCEVENVLSKDCTFLFQKHDLQPPAVDLLDNECARRWKDVIDNYLVRFSSVPAFLSAVTISLVESPEEYISSSQQSASSVDQQHSNL